MVEGGERMKFKSRVDQPTKGLLYGYGINDCWYKCEDTEYYENMAGGRSKKVLFSCYIFKSWRWMLRRVFIDKGYEKCKIQEDWLTFLITLTGLL